MMLKCFYWIVFSIGSELAFALLREAHGVADNIDSSHKAVNNTLVSRANVHISCNPDQNLAIRRGLERVVVWSRLAILSAADDNYSDYERALFIIHFQVDSPGRRRIVRDRFRAIEFSAHQFPGGPILFRCDDPHGGCYDWRVAGYVMYIPPHHNSIVLVRKNPHPFQSTEVMVVMSDLRYSVGCFSTV